jgi:DNA-binding XRE family transcriptional regulator
MKTKSNLKVKKFEKLDAQDYFKTHLNKKLKNPGFKAGFEREKRLLAVTIELAQLRRKKHMSQRDLASKANVPQQEISNIEQGKRNITLNTLEKIANGLDADIDIIVKPHAV